MKPPSALSALLLTLALSSYLRGAATEGATVAVPRNAAEVEALIDGLTSIDSFDVGLSAGMSGSDFPPIAGQYHFGAGLLSPAVPHGRNESLLHLVQAGPSALALLLKHLDDPRPTRLKVTHDDSFGVMSFGKEVRAPKWAGEPESAALKSLPDRDSSLFDGGSIREYSVTVGDACFAIVGMITNRAYNAVRYQPTACIVLNSPTHDPEIAKAVRAIWAGGSGPDALHASLNRDLEHGDPGAATRLLYDFPTASAGPVVTRLKAIAAGKDRDLEGFIQAIAWSPDTVVREALRPLVMSSRDAGVVAAGALALAATGESGRRDELLALAQRWKTSASDPQGGAAAAVLEKALECSPDQADATLGAFLKKATDPIRLEAVQACYLLDRSPVSPLQPLLEIKRPGYGYYLKDGEGAQDSPGANDYVAYRMCDHTYELISRTLGDREAKCTGSAVAMDQRIATLKQRLAAGATSFAADEITARQAEQNQIRDRRRVVLDRIAQAAGDPAKHAAAVFLEDSLPEADRQAALIQLYDNSVPDPHSLGGPRDMMNLLLNRRNPRELLIDQLDPDTRRQVVEHLVQRMATALARKKTGNYPYASVCDDYTLASLRLSEIGDAQGPTLMAVLQAAFQKQGLPPAADFRSVVQAANALLDQNIPGAAEWLSAVCEKVSPAYAEKSGSFREMVSAMVTHRDLATLREAGERMFLGPKSPWNPAMMSHNTADQMNGDRFLEIPAFKKALLITLSEPAIRDEKWGSATREESGSMLVQWRGEQGQTQSSISETDSCDLAVGDPPLTIRRVDGLLTIFSFFNRGEDDSLYFNYYWSRGRRDQVIRRWIEMLAKP